MNAKILRLLMFTPWLAVPAVALRYWTLRDQLPETLAVHFDIHNRPNGWMARDTFFWQMLTILIFQLAVFTAILLASRRQTIVHSLFIGLANAIAAFLTFIFFGLLAYNLDPAREPLQHMMAITIAFIVLAVAMAAAIRLRRAPGTELRQPRPQLPTVRASEGRLIAEEVHSHKLWAAILALPEALALWILYTERPENIRLFAIPVTLVILGAVAFVWRGFTYRFTTAGVEVRSLGIRLRFIPRPAIREYKIEPCDPLADFGGWGVKGRRGETAYIWAGHTGVRIRTWNGDVYLGHEQPERLVSDLDMVMHAV